MSFRTKVFLGVGFMSLIWFGWWVSDIPIGYYQFKKICGLEGGLVLEVK